MFLASIQTDGSYLESFSTMHITAFRTLFFLFLRRTYAEIRINNRSPRAEQINVPSAIIGLVSPEARRKVICRESAQHPRACAVCWSLGPKTRTLGPKTRRRSVAKVRLVRGRRFWRLLEARDADPCLLAPLTTLLALAAATVPPSVMWQNCARSLRGLPGCVHPSVQYT